MFHAPSSLLLIVAAVLLAAASAYADWRWGVIPNALTLPLLALGPIVNAWSARGLRPPVGSSGPLFAVVVSIAGAISCGLVPLLLFRLRLAGGGDVKLFSAIGAMLLPSIGLASQFCAFALAAVFVPARLAYRGRLFTTVGRMLAMVANPALPAARRQALPDEMAETLRLGPFILLGTLIALLLSRSTP